MFTPGTVLLHDTLYPHGENLWFSQPRDVLVARNGAGIKAALTQLEAANRAGLHAAGYLAYEAGFAFEERLEPFLPKDAPLLWLGLYNAPERLSAAEVDQRLAAIAGDKVGTAFDITPRWDEARYGLAFDRVKELIASGDTYQVNLTLKADFRLEGDPVALYRELVRKQAVAYGALINTGTQWILSRSPELFVSSRDNALSARPMKGTLKRGRTLAEDEAGRIALANDEKNRAENLMIVDLLRNDLGRIAEIGSVKVTDLFTVETYQTLHTMTSGITAKRRPDVGTADVLANLFPCGSITGAPKLRAMEIIREVEAGPRGLYTGSIGHFAPTGDFTLNVAIRTAVIDNSGQGEIGIGGGIVADSVAAEEYREALLKMAFFTEPAKPVTLIETLLWQRDTGYTLLDRHLTRMEASAAYFALPYDRAAIMTLLQSQNFAEPLMRVRLTLDASGPAMTAVPLPPNPDVFRFAIAPERLDSQSLWLMHKTTNRAFYDEPRQRAHAALGVDEVVFLNQRGELAEGSITNLFIERDGMLLTPPLSSGLLPGTLRAELIATGKAVEQLLTLDDLDSAEAIWLGNSVRGLLRAQYVRT
ncbi:para-aminobenzoate synthetase / 4-amino-4-deoxychorismate lyase [Devosia sp. YR412]|uniref:aminodeoxychorismate synthase component I n=1 Tax=Devosia sp. YR412 TaxID=1881030 RepID=UPI0008C5746C|nr:aminodeoxychorismate synthase component I [Devosia sp. YR412]SEQ22286.1 para-aminobenzoate synthetase / 4-amino-4-deoxychorismate lyase [Devosia sp. YR412]